MNIAHYLGRAVVLAISALVCLWMVSGARAEINRLVDISASQANADKAEIVLTFSSNLDRNGIVTRFERNFLQFAIKGTSAYPAKTKSIGHDSMDKVFAYQFQPDVSRARVFFPTDAQAMRDKVEWEVQGNKLHVYVQSEPGAAKNAVTAEPSRSPAIIAQSDKLTSNASAPARKKSTLTKDEERLLQSMQKGMQEKTSVAAEAKDPVFSGMRREAKADPEANETASLGVGKVIFNLIIVLGIIGAIAFGFKRFVLKRGFGMALANNNPKKLMQVIHSHNLAPGKTLTIVKVGEQNLLLGVTANSINMLAEVDIEVPVPVVSAPKTQKASQESGSRTAFDRLLETELGSEGQKSTDSNVQISSPAKHSVRESIKQRMRSFKEL